ncbi:MAG: DUF3256 family protein [Prevotella sp.]|nr:DUF3256 family protein [Prevotella sp.]
MKKIFIIATLLIATLLHVDAQSPMRDLWIQMPDSVVAYLDVNSRTEMADFYEMKVKTGSKNLLEGKSAIDSLTSDYIHVTLNSSTTLQIKKLQTESSFVICLIKTFTAPEPESEVSFFSSSWKPLKETFGLPVTNDASSLIKQFTTRPDTISQERYEELASMLDLVMISAEMSVNEQVVTFSLSRPLIEKSEILNINAIFKQRKFKWNGQTFIEC